MFRLLGENIPAEIEAIKEGFRKRDIFLDCRGTLLIDPTAGFAFNIRIYTQSHDINDFRKVVDRPVIVERNAFVGSDCILYNCTIREGAKVSVGSVIKNMEVPAWTIVSGNPPKIVAVFDKEKQVWRYLNIKKGDGEL